MKWFKHSTSASNEEFLIALEYTFGLEGYARYFKLMELIARRMDESNQYELVTSWGELEYFLKGKPIKLKKLLNHLQEANEITWEYSAGALKITCPKLQSMMEDYTKKSQAKTKAKIKEQNTQNNDHSNITFRKESGKNQERIGNECETENTNVLDSNEDFSKSTPRVRVRERVSSEDKSSSLTMVGSFFEFEEPENKPPEIGKYPKIGKPPKVGLDDLSVDHVKDWLAMKRMEGRYLQHDEFFVLEYFKNYCKSKGKRYADYIYAYRNAFEWNYCQPRTTANYQPTKTDRAREAVLEGLAAYEASLAAGRGGYAEIGGYGDLQ